MSLALNSKLEDIGWTHYHTNILLQTGLCWFHEYYWMNNLSLIIDEARDTFQANGQMMGIMGSLFMLGLASGAYIWGYLADIKGRVWATRRIILLSLLPTLAIFATSDYYILCFELFFLGSSLGGEQSVSASILIEFLPQSKYKIFPVLMVIWIIGGLAQGLITSALYYIDLSTEIWRSQVLITAIFEIVLLFFRYFIKETPKWLLESGNFDECYKTLIFLEEKTDIYVQIIDAPQTVYQNQLNQEFIPKENLFLSLFNKSNIRATIVIAVTFFTLNYVFIAFLLFMPTMITDIGLGTQDKITKYLIISAQQCACLLGAIGAWISVAFKVENKYTIIIGCTIKAISVISLYFFKDFNSVLIFSSLLFFGSCFTWTGLYCICAIIYPTYMRTIGQGWGNSLGKFGALLAPFITGSLSDNESGFGLIVIIIAIMILFAIFASLFFKEHRKSS